MRTTWTYFLFLLFALIVRAAWGGPLEDLSPGEWYEVPNSRLDAHKPDPTPHGNLSNIIDAWNSGAFDTKRQRLLIWGGGHCDYSGNEIYAFDMHTLSWSRIWGPTPVELIPTCQEADGGVHTYSDGNPSPRHTYDTLEYIPEPVDGLIEASGAAWGGGGGGTFIFSFKTNSWQELARAPEMRLGMESVYDPETQRYFMRARSAMLAFDPIGNVWSELSRPCEGGCDSAYMTAELDPTKDLIVFVGDESFAIYDIRADRSSEPVTSGATEIESVNAPGVAYDSSSDLIVAWGGAGSARPQDVYTLDLNDLGDLRWTRVTPAATNTVIPSNPRKGTYGRFRYSSAYNVFVLYNNVSENVFVYKLGEGSGGAGNVRPGRPLNLVAQ